MGEAIVWDAEQPEDWSQLQWHRDPGSKRYHSRTTAARACRWMNSHEHPGDRWTYRPGGVDPDGRVWLERRWVGHWDGIT